MRRNSQINRLTLAIVSLVLCSGLMFFSIFGILSPAEDLLSLPLLALTGFLTNGWQGMNDALNQSSDIIWLQNRVGALEEQVVKLQAEVTTLREVGNDYERLADLLDYTSRTQNQEFVTADVIGVDQQSSIRSILINRGTRDGLAVGMPVVTELGLVGRIYDLSANAARVQLITDQNSAISGRLQTSRAEGSIQGRGLLTGTLRMLHISVDARVAEGDLVVTSGLGGNFPPDIVMGVVTSYRNFEFELSQEAEIRSFIDFSRLEFVLIITSFEPADISVFEQ